MTSFRSAGLSPGLTLALLVAAAGAVPAAETPVVLALDSSRSLSPAESRINADLSKALLAGLSGAAESGVLVFDDEVRWLARPGTPGAAGELDALAPSGRHTVLNDGLIEGVRALPDGGVLVLLSDGMDENSATTLEDAARLATDRGVRLVTVGAGRADERTLRRLALLTGGLYAGRARALDVPTLLADIETSRREIAAERAKPTPAVEVSAEPAAATAPTVVPPPPAGSSWPPASSLLLVGAALAALGIVLGFLLARRRAGAASRDSQEPGQGTQPGVHWPEPAAPAPGATAAWSATGTSPGTAPGTSSGSAGAAVGSSPFSAAPKPIDEVQIARVRLRPAVRPQGLMEISLDETAAFQRLPFSESIERTLVLTAEVVLTVREPGRDPHSYRLPPDRAVDIGRDATLNTLAFQDPTMSTQHLRVVLDNEEVYLVDLGSTNGVLVGERRVDAVQLQPGDRFRAGMIEFELGLHHASTGRVEPA